MRRSALATTAPIGATVDTAGGRLARSIRRLYSVSDNVTDRDASIFDTSIVRTGVWLQTMFASETNAAVKRAIFMMILLRSGSSRTLRAHAFHVQLDAGRRRFGGQLRREKDLRTECRER